MSKKAQRASSARNSRKYGISHSSRTPHVVGPSADLLHVDPELRPYVFPLLSVDLADVTDDLAERLLFVYSEYCESGGALTFSVNERGLHTLTPRSSIEYRRYINEVELQSCPVPKKWRFEFLRALPLEVPGNVADIVDLRALIPGPGRSSFPSHPIFGGEPLWIQTPQPPVGPDGKPMRFIGQVQATHFTSSVADFELYLFYSRKHRLVTQVAQIS